MFYTCTTVWWCHDKFVWHLWVGEYSEDCRGTQTNLDEIMNLGYSPSWNQFSLPNYKRDRINMNTDFYVSSWLTEFSTSVRVNISIWTEADPGNLKRCNVSQDWEGMKHNVKPRGVYRRNFIYNKEQKVVIAKYIKLIF